MTIWPDRKRLRTAFATRIRPQQPVFLFDVIFYETQ